MPKIGGKRKKTRTHKEEGPEGDEIVGKMPKSLIFRRGKLNKPLKEIVQDFREIMYPYTAMKLQFVKYEQRLNFNNAIQKQESDKTKIKDYLSASRVYGMTHMTILTSTENHNYIRFIKNPEGPTITFKIISYCNRRDVVNASKKNKSFSRQFQPAMLILNGFNKQSNASVRNPPTLPQQQIVAQMIQSMFPPLSLKNTKASNLQRVILFSYDNEKDVVNMRHYQIQLVPTGVNKNIKKIIKQDKKAPNLSKFNSFADFVQNKKTLSGFQSESDAEELPDSKIDVDQKSYISGKESFKKQFSIRLNEIGPRLKLRLYKIEEGLLRGNVVYNRRVIKTSEEIEDQRKEILRKEIEKEKRKKEQEKRIKAKERELKQKEREKREKRRLKEEERQKKAENGEDVEDEEQNEEDEDVSDVDADIDVESDFEGEDEDIDYEGELSEMDDEEEQKPQKQKKVEKSITQNKENTEKKEKKQQKQLNKDIYEKDELDSEDELQNLEDELNKIQNKKKNYQFEQDDEEDEDENEDYDDDEDDEDEDDNEEYDEIDEDDEVEGDSDDEEEEEVKEPKLKKKNKKY